MLHILTSWTLKAALTQGLTVCCSGGHEMPQPNKLMSQAYIRRY